MSARRVVLDANVLISSILKPTSVPGRAVSHAIHSDLVLISEALIGEVLTVLTRPKFAAFIEPSEARAVVFELIVISATIPVTAHVQVCRDPDDDHVLALALSGEADIIVTGDQDLLILDPFRGVRILTPQAFMALKSGEPGGA